MGQSAVLASLSSMGENWKQVLVPLCEAAYLFASVPRFGPPQLGAAPLVVITSTQISLGSRRAVIVRFLLTGFSSCRDDSNPVRVSGHIPGWPLGEEAQPVCSGSHQDGHAGEPGVHSLLRVFPLPGMRHRTCGGGYCSLRKQVSPQSVSGSRAALPA